ncbi:hypothetical protein AZ033_005172, partial [Klebsiella pneumoniae]
PVLLCLSYRSRRSTVASNCG